MPVIVQWYESSDRILLYRFEGVWTWEEYYIALAQGRTMEKDAAHAVCTINDMRLTTYMPQDFIERARTVSLTRPASTALAVYISDNYHFTTIYDVLANLDRETKTRYPLVKTEAAALALIAAWFEDHPGE